MMCSVSGQSFGLVGGLGLVLVLLSPMGCGVKKYNDLKKQYGALELRNQEMEKQSDVLRKQLDAVKQTSIRLQRWVVHPYREGDVLDLEGEGYVQKVRFQRKGSVITATAYFNPEQSVRPHFKLYFLDREARVCAEIEVRWLVYKIGTERQRAVSNTGIDAEKEPIYFSLRFFGT